MFDFEITTINNFRIPTCDKQNTHPVNNATFSGLKAFKLCIYLGKQTYRIISQLNNSAAGYDGLPASIMKQLDSAYIIPLTYMINLCPRRFSR